MLNPVRVNLSKETLEKLKASKYRDMRGNQINVGDYVSHISTKLGRDTSWHDGVGTVVDLTNNKTLRVHVKYPDGSKRVYAPSTLTVTTNLV